MFQITPEQRAAQRDVEYIVRMIAHAAYCVVPGSSMFSGGPIVAS
jgi:hypothetical protein